MLQPPRESKSPSCRPKSYIQDVASPGRTENTLPESGSATCGPPWR